LYDVRFLISRPELNLPKISFLITNCRGLQELLIVSQLGHHRNKSLEVEYIDVGRVALPNRVVPPPIFQRKLSATTNAIKVTGFARVLPSDLGKSWIAISSI
jgi:hypothetical protein